MKITKKTTILFTAVILVSAVFAVTAFAYSPGMGNGKEKGHARMFIEPLLIGHGFALNGDQYHILDVNAVKMNTASPGLIRSLLSQKKTHEEIAKEITDNQTANNTRAHLRFAGQAYALNVTAYDNQSLTGDVMTLPPRGTDQKSFKAATIGHISLSISKYEGEMLSTGYLTINNTEYKVLLLSPMNLKNNRN